MVIYKVQCDKALDDGYVASVYCNGSFLTSGAGTSPIEAAADAVERAAALNRELEELI